MTLRALPLAATMICTANIPAYAFDPVGARDFNIKTTIDLKALTTANFYDF